MKRMHIYLPDHVIAQLKAQSQASGLSVSELIRRKIVESETRGKK